jgi:cellulose synthase/poly-beta-1,6-N-acetylglucosamine synthase-like glycosyltransferase
MFIVKIIAVFCLLGYIGILIYSVIGHIRSKEFAAVSSPSTNVCIIVCARNEEKHIELCLLGILAQNFPKELIEIIVVNDASSDKTLELSEKVLSSSGVSYQIISNTEKLGKKYR